MMTELVSEYELSDNGGKVVVNKYAVRIGIDKLMILWYYKLDKDVRIFRNGASLHSICR